MSELVNNVYCICSKEKKFIYRPATLHLIFSVILIALFQHCWKIYFTDWLAPNSCHCSGNGGYCLCKFRQKECFWKVSLSWASRLPSFHVLSGALGLLRLPACQAHLWYVLAFLSSTFFPVLARLSPGVGEMRGKLFDFFFLHFICLVLFCSLFSYFLFPVLGYFKLSHLVKALYLFTSQLVTS